MANILRNSLKNHKAQLTKLIVFVGKNSIFRNYYIQNVKDGIHIRVYKINKESVTHSSQFILVNPKQNLKTSQAQFQ